MLLIYIEHFRHQTTLTLNYVRRSESLMNFGNLLNIDGKKLYIKK